MDSRGVCRLTRRAAVGVLGTVPLVGESGARLALDARETESLRPAIGNLFPTVESYTKQRKQSFSFDPARWPSVADWKREARQKCLDYLAYNPTRVSLNARLLAKEQRDGYVQEEITFRSSTDIQVAASLLIPKRPGKRFPALVALHDHGGFYFVGRDKLLARKQPCPLLDEFCQKLYEGVAYSATLARAGFVVLVIDAFYFGARRLREDSVPSTAETRHLSALPAGSTDYIRAYNAWAHSNEQLIARTLFLAGATWPGLLAWDDGRSVDYLLTRPEVDSDRIGCLGLSLGGFRSAFLAGLHPRIRSAVVTCWMTSFEPMLANYAGRHTWMIHAPGLYQYLDLPDIASQAAPNPLLLQYGTRDDLFPKQGKTESARKLKTTYTQAGAADSFEARFYDAPHMFSKQMQHDAFEWLGRTLT